MLITTYRILCLKNKKNNFPSETHAFISCTGDLQNKRIFCKFFTMIF